MCAYKCLEHRLGDLRAQSADVTLAAAATAALLHLHLPENNLLTMGSTHCGGPNKLTMYILSSFLVVLAGADGKLDGHGVVRHLEGQQAGLCNIFRLCLQLCDGVHVCTIHEVKYSSCTPEATGAFM